jgi:hypothetical protein
MVILAQKEAEKTFHIKEIPHANSLEQLFFDSNVDLNFYNL